MVVAFNRAAFDSPPTSKSARNPLTRFNLQFTIDKNQDLSYHCVCYLEQTSHTPRVILALTLGPSTSSSLFFRAPVATQLTPQLTLMLLITSVQTQHFHAITHFHPEPNPRRAFPQRRHAIPPILNSFRTLLPLTAISFFRSFPPIPDTASISSRINTCKSVSKQTTLTPFTINTYEKHREGGPPSGGGAAPSSRNKSKSKFVFHQSAIKKGNACAAWPALA